jgi:hypothetical protein
MDVSQLSIRLQNLSLKQNLFSQPKSVLQASPHFIIALPHFGKLQYWLFLVAQPIPPPQPGLSDYHS